MNTTVQNTISPKTVLPRRSKFPGKESGSVSFNLTAIGRQLLKDQASEAKVSNGDYVEMLIRERDGLPPIKIATQAKQTGPKGGAKSYFFGKNRGTTTAVCVTPIAHKMLDTQVAEARMSRGDYVEYLLRLKANMLDESLKSMTEAETLEETGSMGVASESANQVSSIVTAEMESVKVMSMGQEETMPEPEVKEEPKQSSFFTTTTATGDSETRTMSNQPSSNSFFTQNW